VLTAPARLPEDAEISGGEGHGIAELLAGSAWLVATTAVIAVAGFAFWLLAAHSHSQATVGRASALYSAVLFLVYATNMGLPVALARYSADESQTARVLFSWSIIYSLATSAVATIILVVAAPDTLLGSLWQWGHLAGTGLLAWFVMALAASTLLDVRMMTLRLWRWVFIRALLAGVVRVALVGLHPRVNGALWIFLVFAGSLFFSAILGVVALRRATKHVFQLRPRPPNTAAAFYYANVNYVGQLAVQAPFMVLPVIVALNVQSAVNASFYVAWSIAGVIFIVPQVVGQALLAEGGKGGARLETQAAVAAAATVGFAVVAAALTLMASGLVTDVFGRSYVEAAHLLPVLALPAAAWAVTSTCLTYARVRHDHRSVIAITMALAAGVLVPAVVLTSRYGATGAAEAWVIGHIVAAIVAVVATRGRAVAARGARMGGWRRARPAGALDSAASLAGVPDNPRRRHRRVHDVGQAGATGWPHRDPQDPARRDDHAGEPVVRQLLRHLPGGGWDPDERRRPDGLQP
jgi:O-antigen/teichoic acid export membrane protein